MVLDMAELQAGDVLETVTDAEESEVLDVFLPAISPNATHEAMTG